MKIETSPGIEMSVDTFCQILRKVLTWESVDSLSGLKISFDSDYRCPDYLIQPVAGGRLSARRAN